MKRILTFILLLTLAGGVACRAAESPRLPAVSDSTAKELAKSVTMITGMAISPLLSVGVVGAYGHLR